MVLKRADMDKKRSRRLRKKLHLGEFQELGFTLSFTIDPQQKSCEDALDSWIEYVESQGWCFGGGGAELGNEIAGFLCQYRRGTLTESDRGLVACWLSIQPWVTAQHLDSLSDVWYCSGEDEIAICPSICDQVIDNKGNPLTKKTVTYFPNEVVGLQLEQGFSLLAAWRHYRGLSQADLADRVGMSVEQLVALEQPSHRLTHSHIIPLADALNIQVEHLLD